MQTESILWITVTFSIEKPMQQNFIAQAFKSHLKSISAIDC